MPDGAVYVGRPTRFGNPFHPGNGFSLEDVIVLYESWLTGFYGSTSMPPTTDVSLLRGKDLACWCPLDKPCHADVLLRLANQ